MKQLDPALVTLAHDGSKTYRTTYDLLYRREAERPNELWQADHTLLDLWVRHDSGPPVRPWRGRPGARAGGAGRRGPRGRQRGACPLCPIAALGWARQRRLAASWPPDSRHPIGGSGHPFPAGRRMEGMRPRAVRACEGDPLAPGVSLRFPRRRISPKSSADEEATCLATCSTVHGRYSSSP